MPRLRELRDFSQLEREFELEMEDESEADEELEGDEEFETDEEADEEFEDLEASDDEFERDDEFEAFESENDNSGEREYVERLMELSTRSYESESEVDQAMNEVLDDMSREYLFGSIKRGWRKLSRNKILRGLAKKGFAVAAGKFPGLKAAMQLAQGNVKGALLNFGKQALGTVVPGSTVALDALKSIGIGANESPESSQESWENYVSLAREAYEHLGDNVTEIADQPAEASRLANNAIQHAVRRAQVRTAQRRRHPGRHRKHRRHGQLGGGAGGRVVRLRVAPGQRVKIIIVGG